MKADVVSGVPELGIPSWVPEPIAQHVRAMHVAWVHSIYYEALKEDRYLNDAIVQDELADAYYLPLACDPRMKGVWRELSRQRNGAFLHPALIGDQDAALIDLFNTALTCRVQREVTTTRRHAEQERDRFLAKATELQHDAARMDWEHFATLSAAAQVYEDHAREIHATRVAMALERQHDGRARWIALTMAKKFRTLFGSSTSMYGLTAIITSVILDRDIDPSKVRYWCATLQLSS
jgi:hypothetical protein